MPKIVSRKLRWNPVAGSDGFNIYFAPTAPGPSFTYDSPHADVGVPPKDADGKHVVYFKDVPALAALPEGAYDFAVTAYDAAGNESDFTEVENVPLDLTAPEPVTGLEVGGE
jgi:hypothetical protein